MFGCCCNQGPERPETPERRIVRGIVPWNPKGAGVIWNTNLDQEAVVIRPFNVVSETGSAACAWLYNNTFTFDPGWLSGVLTSNEMAHQGPLTGLLSSESIPSNRYFHALVNVSWQNIQVTGGVAAAVSYATEFEVDADYRDGLLNNLRYELSTYSPGPWYEYTRDEEGTVTETDHTSEHPYDLGGPYHNDLSNLGTNSALVSATVEADDDEFSFEVVVDVDYFGDASQIVRLTYSGTITLTGKRTFAQQNTEAEFLANTQPFASLAANSGMDVRWIRAGGGFTYDAEVVTDLWALFPDNFGIGISCGAYSALLSYSPSQGWLCAAYAAQLVWTREQWLLPTTWGDGMVEPLPVWTFILLYDTDLNTSHAGHVGTLSCYDGQVWHGTEISGGWLSGTATSLTIQTCPSVVSAASEDVYADDETIFADNDYQTPP